MRSALLYHVAPESLVFTRRAKLDWNPKGGQIDFEGAAIIILAEKRFQSYRFGHQIPPPILPLARRVAERVTGTPIADAWQKIFTVLRFCSLFSKANQALGTTIGQRPDNGRGNAQRREPVSKAVIELPTSAIRFAAPQLAPRPKSKRQSVPAPNCCSRRRNSDNRRQAGRHDPRGTSPLCANRLARLLNRPGRDGGEMEQDPVCDKVLGENQANSDLLILRKV